MSLPMNVGSAQPSSSPSFVVTSVSMRRAEELIATLQGVLSVRIVASGEDVIEEVHVLTTDAVLPKQAVRNIESALMAQLGIRVSHRKISIATTLDNSLSRAPRASSQTFADVPVSESSSPQSAAAGTVPLPSSGLADIAGPSSNRREVAASAAIEGRRALIFEDVEVRRSRSRGVMVRVTVRRGGVEFVGEVEGHEAERSRIDLAARAALAAINAATADASGSPRALTLEGSKLIEAFDREFIFVSVNARIGRDAVILTGSCAIREGAETSAVLATLDATNRWMNLDR